MHPFPSPSPCAPLGSSPPARSSPSPCPCAPLRPSQLHPVPLHFGPCLLCRRSSSPKTLARRAEEATLTGGWWVGILRLPRCGLQGLQPATPRSACNTAPATHCLQQCSHHPALINALGCSTASRLDCAWPQHCMSPGPAMSACWMVTDAGTCGSTVCAHLLVCSARAPTGCLLSAGACACCSAVCRHHESSSVPRGSPIWPI